jgi:uncharacterized delta-60 repeat protein
MPDGRRHRIRTRVRGCRVRLTLLVAVAVVPVCVAMGVLGGTSSASSVTVNFSVGTATMLDTSGCLPGVVALGSVPAGSAVRSGRCTVQFGSTSTSTLLMRRVNGFLPAMATIPPVELDTGFDGDGVWMRSLGPGADEVRGIAVQPDGKTILIGSTEVGTQDDSFILRLNTDGTLDTSFAAAEPTPGILIRDFSAVLGGAGLSDQFRAVLVLEGGTILAGGRFGLTSSSSDTMLARFTSAGVLDTGFSSDGLHAYPISTHAHELITSLAVRPDGSYVMAGQAWGAGWDSFVGIIDPDSGVALPTFNGGSVLRTDLTGSGNNDTGGRVHVLPDGRVILFGNGNFLVSTDRDLYVARFLEDGSLDPSWGTSGLTVVAPMGISDDRSDDGSVVLPDGRLVIQSHGFRGSPQNWNTFLTMLDAEGNLDLSFGVDGIAEYHYSGNDYGSDLVQLTDGRLLMLIRRDTNVSGIRLAMVNPADGSLDTSYSGDGWHEYNIAALDMGRDMVVGPDRRVMIGGRVGTTAEMDVAVVAMPAAESIPDHAPGTNDWASGNGLFGVCLEAVGGAGVTAGASWTVDGDGNCTTTDADPWRAVPTSLTHPAMRVAESTVAGTMDATATLRFGARPPAAVTPGGPFVAPIQVDVIAPIV